MDEPKTWDEVAARPEMSERGAQLRLARHLGMDPSYLNRKLRSRLELKVSELRGVKSFLGGQPMEQEPPPGRRVPVFGYAAMGASGVEDEGDVIAMGEHAVLDWMELPAGISPRGDCFVIYPLGASMEPRIFAGEPLLVLRHVPPLRDGDALIEFTDGAGVVKSYRGTRDGWVWARQYNPERERRYEAASVKGIHRILRL